MICRFLTDRDFSIVETLPLHDGQRIFERGGMPPMLVIMVDRGSAALDLIGNIEKSCSTRHIARPGILLWSEYDNFTHVTSAWGNGAVPRSFIGREETAEDLITAIWKTVEGTRYLPSRLAKKINKIAPVIREKLSDREKEIFTAVQLGLTNDAIADRLGIKRHSVENALKGIYEKMGVNSREELYRL
jgi:DNA-binding NarL/FixJ family response regulator